MTSMSRHGLFEIQDTQNQYKTNKQLDWCVGKPTLCISQIGKICHLYNKYSQMITEGKVSR